MEKLIETFYSALNNCDGPAMISCYHNDVVFEDPAFGELKGDTSQSHVVNALCISKRERI